MCLASGQSLGAEGRRASRRVWERRAPGRTGRQGSHARSANNRLSWELHQPLPGGSSLMIQMPLRPSVSQHHTDTGNQPHPVHSSHRERESTAISHSTGGMEGIMPRGKWDPEGHIFMIAFLQNVHNKQIHRDREEITGHQGWGRQASGLTADRYRISV